MLNDNEVVVPASGNEINENFEKATFDEGMLIGGRFKILSKPEFGGMSAVYKARDTDSGLECAIKIALISSDENLAKLSFERETKALGTLSHRNIANYLDSGKENDVHYIALEWIGSGSLAQMIKSNGPQNWVDFFEMYGRKILDALAYAHRREWADRDLKPQNILIDKDGCPKIIDFGIARDTTQSQLNNTFFKSGSPPYTPPEADDSYQSTRRDVFSWSAIAVSCLTGEIYKDYKTLIDALEQLGNKSVPKGDLLKALSLKVADRQESANILLADMDSFHIQTLSGSRVKTEIYFQSPTASVIAELVENFSALPPQDVGNYIENDFNSSWAATFEIEDEHLIIVGATIRAVCKVDETALKILKLTVHSPHRAGELREELCSIPSIVFKCGVAVDFMKAKKNLRSLIQRLEIVDDSLIRLAEEKKRNYWLECWSEFLREKERVYKVKQLGVRVVSIRPEGEFYIATVEGEVEREQLGDSLVIQTGGGKPLIFLVIDLQADQLILALKSGGRSDIPFGKIVLETNFEAERKAIQKQRTALDDIRTGGTVNPHLGQILSTPQLAKPAILSGGEFPDFLSEDKQRILDKAMGVESILVVNGPPGTGKTTLIAELIEAYLARYPSARILLSSQTHVALDNIIIKLVEKNISNDIVRIVSMGSENVHKVHRLAEALTLESKVHQWCIDAERRSEEFIEEYARNVGLNAFDLKAELLGSSYAKALENLRDLKRNIILVSKRAVEIDDNRKRELENGLPLDQEEILTQTQNVVLDTEALKESVQSTEARLARLKESLNKMDGLGDLFESASESELKMLLDGLVRPSSKRDMMLPIIQLHIDWINRLGSERPFHGAVLKEARVIAGTCIGLGGIFGFQHEMFDLCIIDEASKATATEALVPMSRSKCSILVGDPEQLPPYIENAGEQSDSEFSFDAKKSLLSILLENLPSENVEELLEQRRMCQSIGNMVSKIFYGDRLHNVRLDTARKVDIVNLYPKPVTWISTSNANCREQITTEKSFKNEGEANVIVEELRKIARKTRGKKEKIHVAIISAYSAQVTLLKDLIDHHIGIHDGFTIEVNTVDSFQGREADVCIYSVTRSNDNRQIGFQREKKRLNVALSRARDALVLVGDQEFCSNVKGNIVFLSVIEYIKENTEFCETRKP